MNTEEEKIIFKTHPHYFGFLIFYISGFLIFISGYFVWWPLYLVGAFVFLVGEIARISETYKITEHGLSREYNLFSSSKDFAEFDKIQNIEVRQSFLEKIFGIGNVHMDTAGGNKTEVNFNLIHNPYYVESIIRNNLK